MEQLCFQQLLSRSIRINFKYEIIASNESLMDGFISKNNNKLPIDWCRLLFCVLEVIIISCIIIKNILNTIIILTIVQLGIVGKITFILYFFLQTFVICHSHIDLLLLSYLFSSFLCNGFHIFQKSNRFNSSYKVLTLSIFF